MTAERAPEVTTAAKPEPRTVIERARAAVAGELLATATKLVASTIRVRTEGMEQVVAHAGAGRPVLFVTWHGNALVSFGFLPKIFPAQPRAILTRDDLHGLTLQRAARRLAIEPVSLGMDPDSPEWTRALVRFMSLLRRGVFGCVAPDGPAGPAHTVKPGAALMAQRVGAVIIPAGIAGRPAYRVPRWDRHLIPLPFSKLAIALDAAIEARPRDEPAPTIDELCARIGAALQAATSRAEVLLTT